VNLNNGELFVLKTDPFIVTIDGPSASGKSSVSRALAKRHGWPWLSTGAFYRGLAVVAKAKGIPVHDEMLLVALAESDEWSVHMTQDRTLVSWQGKDISEQVYREETGADASKISQLPKVRASLLESQRQCSANVKGLVAEGRDCGTVVFPNAQVKIYLTAGSEERFARRAREEGRDVAETRAAQTQRDLQDATRASAPMQVPPNAIIVDTSSMDLNAVIEVVDRHVLAAIGH
jgi:CMP/dCMP kinase